MPFANVNTRFLLITPIPEKRFVFDTFEVAETSKVSKTGKRQPIYKNISAAHKKRDA